MREQYTYSERPRQSSNTSNNSDLCIPSVWTVKFRRYDTPHLPRCPYFIIHPLSPPVTPLPPPDIVCGFQVQGDGHWQTAESSLGQLQMRLAHTFCMKCVALGHCSFLEFCSGLDAERMLVCEGSCRRGGRTGHFSAPSGVS
jgi:hypothetical protein